VVGFHVGFFHLVLVQQLLQVRLQGQVPQGDLLCQVLLLLVVLLQVVHLLRHLRHHHLLLLLLAGQEAAVVLGVCSV
jgi:hypothetical protein